MRIALAIVLSALSVSVAGAGSGGSVRVPGRPIEELADIVIDLTNSNDIKILDVDDEDEETADKTVLCIAPPCGLRADAVPLTQLPVPWSLRLTPPTHVA